MSCASGSVERILPSSHGIREITDVIMTFETEGENESESDTQDRQAKRVSTIEEFREYEGAKDVGRAV